MANKIMIGSVKLSELRRMMDCWFIDQHQHRMSKKEAEAMVRDVLRTVGIAVEDDIVLCSKCKRPVEFPEIACRIDDPNDGSAACFNYDRFKLSGIGSKGEGSIAGSDGS